MLSPQQPSSPWVFEGEDIETTALGWPLCLLRVCGKNVQAPFQKEMKTGNRCVTQSYIQNLSLSLPADSGNPCRNWEKKRPSAATAIKDKEKNLQVVRAHGLPSLLQFMDLSNFFLKCFLYILSQVYTHVCESEHMHVIVDNQRTT